MAACGCSSEATPLIRTQSGNPRNSPLIILGTLCTPGWWLGLGCCDQIARDQFGKSEISARRFFVFLLSELNPGHAISYRVAAAAKYLYALSGVFLYFCLKHIPQEIYQIPSHIKECLRHKNILLNENIFREKRPGKICWTRSSNTSTSSRGRTSGCGIKTMIIKR